MVCASNESELQRLHTELVHKSALIEALKAEVIRLRRWKFGRSAEVVDITVMPELPLTGGTASTPPLREPATAIRKLESVDKPQGSRPRRAPRALPPELPRVIRIHEPRSCSCPECGETLKALGEDVSEQLDYVPGYFQVIRHIRPKLVCSPCARIVQAASPSRPIERGLATPALLAQVIAAKYADHCPLYRQEVIYRRSGVELPRAMLADWVGQSAMGLPPLVSALERYVMQATKLHADDTPVPVLQPGKGRCRTGQLWAYVRDDRPAAGPDPPAVLYRYSPDRKGEHPEAHLSLFRGTLQADGYAGFNGLYERAEHPLLEAACWAHARRKYYDVYLAERSATALEAIHRIGELYAIERAIRGQAAAYRRQIRQERAAPRLAQLRTWLRAQLAGLSVKSPLATAIRYPTSTASTRVKVKYGYAYGILSTVTDWTSGSAGTVYWTANTQNVAGQTTQETLGNGVVTSRSFDAVTGRLNSIQSGVSGGTGLQNLSYLYDAIGNVTQRQESTLGLTENFYYDNLYRLDYSTLNNGGGAVTNLDLTYDAKGNITARSDVNGNATWAYDSTRKHAVLNTGTGGTAWRLRGGHLHGDFRSARGRFCV